MAQVKYITTTNSPFTLDRAFETYIIDAIDGNITVILPPIVTDGMIFNLRRVDTSGFIVTIQPSDPDLINNSSTANINSRSDTRLVACNGSWFGTTVGSSLGVGRVIQEARITVASSNGNNYITLSSTSGNYVAVASFIYRGSNYYGGVPSLWKITYNTSGSATFNFRLYDVNNSKVVSTQQIVSSTSVSNYPISTNSTFNNVSSGEVTWEVQVQRSSGTASLNLYCLLLNL